MRDPIPKICSLPEEGNGSSQGAGKPTWGAGRGESHPEQPTLSPQGVGAAPQGSPEALDGKNEREAPAVSASPRGTKAARGDLWVRPPCDKWGTGPNYSGLPPAAEAEPV